MKKIISVFALFFFSAVFFSQEALKSFEEEYYEFLSLTGTAKRPTLGYKTLSDSTWDYSYDIPPYIDDIEYIYNDKINEDQVEATEEQKKTYIHPWRYKYLGRKKTLFDNPFINYRFYGLEMYNSINSETPFGYNDGALWQGKGYNASITGGARFELYSFEFTFKPQISFSQNKYFDTIEGVQSSVLSDDYKYNYSWVNRDTITRTWGTNEIEIANYAGGNIDMVQRYGNSWFFNYDWGDSEIRCTIRTFTMGFGTQTPWLGPAYVNPMLGSNNAPSYPKFDIGLRRTKIYIPLLRWYIGDIEARLWTGYLTQSDYYEGTNQDSDHNMLNALSVSYAPAFIPGFSFGMNRIFLTKWKMENLKFIGRLFTASHENGTDSGNDEDQKIAFYADWIFSRIGLEVYGEIGIDDFSQNEETNPFHTAIYTVGLKQYIPLPLKKLFPKLPEFMNLHSELSFEWNNFEMSQDFQLQWPYLGYYSHGSIGQGYTNKGQVLGAATSTFGNSQYLSYKVYYPKGSTKLYFHRFCPNNNFTNSQSARSSKSFADNVITYENPLFNSAYYANYETYYDFGIETLFFVNKNLNINAGFDWVEIFNWRYWQQREKRNLRLTFGMKYNFM
jgi:hypothetical protein